MLVIDIECNTLPNPSPFCLNGSMVCVGLYDGENNGVYPVNPDTIKMIQERVDAADELVGFNFKFDLNWLRRYGIICTHKRIWDVQLAEFLLSRQELMYPSLEAASQKYLNTGKDKTIEENYWAKGIDTCDIPTDVLYNYCLLDCELTYRIAEIQKRSIKDSQKKLFSISMQDLIVLHEMEYNGMEFDREQSFTKAAQASNEITSITLGMGTPCPNFNWNSPDHISSLLYGGTVEEVRRVPVGMYMSGQKKGQQRYKLDKVEHHLPRQYKPIKGTELKKEGKWSVEEDTLLKLGGGDLVKNILKVKELEGLCSKYFVKLPELQDKLGWDHTKIHGNFNQCVAKTGRLSSTQPNLQNFAKEASLLLDSRFKTAA